MSKADLEEELKKIIELMKKDKIFMEGLVRLVQDIKPEHLRVNMETDQVIYRFELPLNVCINGIYRKNE